MIIAIIAFYVIIHAGDEGHGMNNKKEDKVMGYEKKYTEALERAKKIFGKNQKARFDIGTWIVWNDCVYQVLYNEDTYVVADTNGLESRYELSTIDESARLWSIQDAKNGDVLHSPSHRLIWIYKDKEHYHFCANMNFITDNVATNGVINIPADTCPAIKAEQSILFSMLKRSGYEWNAELKELRKFPTPADVGFEELVKQWEKEAYERFRRLYCQQREKEANEQKSATTPTEGEFPYNNPADTLDSEIDNIWNKLSCDNKFTAAKSGFYEVIHHFANWFEKQRPAIEEINGDDYGIDGLWHAQRILDKTLGEVSGYQTDDGILDHKAAITAVKKLREQKPIKWKQENTEELTEFENAMMHIGGSFFGENAGLDPNDTNTIKEQANLLAEFVSKSEWSEEDENFLNECINQIGTNPLVSKRDKQPVYDWLKSLKDRVIPQPKEEWSEEDELNLNHAIYVCHQHGYTGAENWLKSLKDRVIPQPKVEWIYICNDTYIDEPVLAQKKDKSDVCYGYVICVDHTLVAAKYERYIKLSDITGVAQKQWKPTKEQMKWFKDRLDYHQFSSEGQKVMEELYKQLKQL